MNIIAFFDFDGTISKSDSFFKFIRYSVGNLNFFLGLIVLSPILFLYLFNLIPNYKAKQKVISWFFKGYKKKEFEELSNQFSLNEIDKILRPKALERLRWHKQNNHKIVIVSASIHDYLYLWCKKNNYELIATKLEVDKSSLLTGKLATKNCHGIEKVKRINLFYNLNDFDYIYSYGDSNGDKPMLDIADESFYKPFR